MISLDPIKKAAKTAVKSFYGFAEYVNQRNNKIRPSASCNTSAVINAMVEAGIPIMFRKPNERPADTLMRYIDSTQWWDRLHEIDKGSRANPWNYSQILTEAVNKLQGQVIAKWKSVTIEQMRKGLKIHTYVIGGTFSGLGHFVVVHGYDLNHKSFIVDDSWGDAKSHYRDHNGDDLRYGMDFMRNNAFHDRAWKKGRAPVIEFRRAGL